MTLDTMTDDEITQLEDACATNAAHIICDQSVLQRLLHTVRTAERERDEAMALDDALWGLRETAKRYLMDENLDQRDLEDAILNTPTRTRR